MSAFSQLWFWILLVGLLLVVIGTIIRGVHCQMSGWAAAFLIIGFILVLIGVALGLWAWANMAHVEEKHCEKVYVAPSPVYTQYSPMTMTQQNIREIQYSPSASNVTDKFKYANHPQVIHSPHVTPSPVTVQNISSPTIQRVVSIPTLPPLKTTTVVVPSATVSSMPVSPMSLSSNSPIIPTPVTTNIPQAQRGFSTSGVDLSALSPV